MTGDGRPRLDAGVPAGRTQRGNDAKLTLADLERIAAENNPTLAGAAARADAARGRHTQAGLWPNPVIGYHATEVGNLGTAGAQGGFIAQRFITGGKLRLDQAVAQQEVQEADFRYYAQEQRVLSDVRVRFYEALAAQRRVELTKELATIGENLAKASKTLLDTKQGTENDFIQAEIRADEARILYDNARNENVEAWRRLATVAGVPEMTTGTLAGRLDADPPDLNWDASLAATLGGNEQLNAARVRVERAAAAIRRAERQPIPDIDVFVSVRHMNITGYDIANIQAGIPVPIFDRNRGAIRAAQSGWIAAHQEVRGLELELQDRLAVAWRRYANARQQAERYGKRIVPRAKKSLGLVTNGYEKGQVNYLTLLLAQRTHIEANLAYINALRDLRSAAALIEGRLLNESLTQR